jgi:dihydrofolate reductase
MIRLIAALDRKRGIAKQGFQPWSIPEDTQYFKDMTKQFGGIVLVGSTTYKTFDGPMSDRQNFVLTRDKESIPGAELVHNLEKFLNEYQDKDIWVIGGANVFSQVMEMGRADELYITNIDADFGCNQYFPEYEGRYNLLKRSELHEQNGFIFSYATFAKINPATP